MQGRGGEGGVVAVGTVELVADQRRAPRIRQVRQAADRVCIDHDAGGIGGRVEQDRAGGGGHRRRDLIDIDAEGRRGVDHHAPATEELDQGPIHHERRFEDDHLVTGIDQGHQHQRQSAARTARHTEPAVGLAQLFLDLLLQPFAERGDALCGRVAIPAGIDGRLGGLAGSRRHLEVGLADREVDGVLEFRREVEDLADAR